MDLMEASTPLEFRDALMKLAGDLSVSFLVGGAIMAVVFTPITYVVVKRMVVVYRIRVEKRRRKRLAILRARVQTMHRQEDEPEEPEVRN